MKVVDLSCVAQTFAQIRLAIFFFFFFYTPRFPLFQSTKVFRLGPGVFYDIYIP